MRGEYKTPGGKLVVVDFEVHGGQLREIEVSGDFFLYPDESLPAITSALEGLPAGSGEAAIALAIDRAIPAGTELLGTSSRGIAIAVGRALATLPEGSHQP